MTYEEFERHILRMVYEQGADRLQPAKLAYVLNLPHEVVTRYLEQAVNAELLELEANDSGRLEYYIPGVIPGQAPPTPLWRQAQAKPPQRESQPTPREDTDGHVQPGEPRQQTRAEAASMMRSYVREREASADGQLVGMRRVGAVLAAGVAIDERPVVISQALAPYDDPHTSILRVESGDDAFCDPSQTIFMRQLRVHGVKSEALLRDQIQRLFESFGYKSVSVVPERMRFERGSVTFILALVPLFVLVLPLFVYLFLYCMGRSTIQQEPLELDVQLRRSKNSESSYEIDLTFIGLHGVVLGAADQRVLNREIDTLRDELRWALAGN